VILDLVRHGDTGRAGHLDGRIDPPLLPDALGPVVARHHGIPWSRIISSPLQRARGTAAALVGRELREGEIDSRWAEFDFGDWDGLVAGDVPAEALRDFHRDPLRHGPPGAEPWSGFTARVRSAVADLLPEAGADPVLVVTHGGPVRTVLADICGLGLSATWSVRIGYGTRVRVWVQDSDAGLWGEVLELTQP